MANKNTRSKLNKDSSGGLGNFLISQVPKLAQRIVGSDKEPRQRFTPPSQRGPEDLTVRLTEKGRIEEKPPVTNIPDITEDLKRRLNFVKEIRKVKEETKPSPLFIVPELADIIGRISKSALKVQIPKALATSARFTSERLKEIFEKEPVFLSSEASIKSSLFKETEFEERVQNFITKKVLNPVAQRSRDVITLLDDEQRKIVEPIIDGKELDMSDWREFVFVAGNAGLSAIGAIGLSVATGSYTTGAIFLGALEGFPVYNEARDAGKSPGESLKITAQSTAGTIALERLGLDFLMKNIGGSVFSRSLVKGIFESGQEELQTFWQNLVEKRGYNKSKKLFDDWFQTLAASFPTGAILGGAVPNISMNTQVELRNRIIEEGGLSEPEANTAVNEMVSSIKEAFRAFNDAIALQKPGLTIEEVGGEQAINPVERVKKNIPFYQQTGTTLQGDIQPRNRPLEILEEEYQKPEVRRFTQNQVREAIRNDEIQLNENDKIDLYRVGKVRKPGLISATYSKEAAEKFNIDNKNINKFEVQPEEIGIFIGGSEAEVLVDASRIAAEVPEAIITKQGKATLTELRKAEGREQAPFVKKRETTLLKERIKNQARGVREGERLGRDRIKTRLQEINDLIEESNLSLKDKAKFRFTPKQIAEIKSDETFQKKVNEVVNRISRLEEAQIKRDLKNQIRDELKSKAIKPRTDEGGVKRGRFTADVQEKLFRIKRNLDGNRVQALSKMMDNIEEYGRADENGQRSEVPEEVAEENALLHMVGINDMTVRSLEETLDNIQSLKEDGKMRNLLRRENRMSRLEKEKDILRQSIRQWREPTGTTKQLNPVLKAADATDNALNGYVETIEKMDFSKSSEATQMVIDKIHPARNKYERTMMEVQNETSRAFNYAFGVENKKATRRAYKQITEEKIMYEGKDGNGNKVAIQMSEAEIISQLNRLERFRALGMNEREVAFQLYKKKGAGILGKRDIVTTPITQEMEESFRRNVSEEMKTFNQWAKENFFPWMRNLMNPRFREKNGVNMGQSPDNTYYPVVRADFEPQDATDLTLGDVFTPPPSAIPSSVRRFTKAKTPVGIDGNIFQVMNRHAHQAIHFASFDEVVTDLRNIFNDEEVKSLVREFVTEGTLKRMNNIIDNIALGGPEARMMIRGLDNINKNFVKAKLALNYVPFLKQITSLPAIAAEPGMTYKKLTKGSIKFMQNPIDWTRFWVENSDTITSRLATGFSVETALAFRKGNFEAEVGDAGISLDQFIKKSLVMPTRGGDMIPILPGITAVYLTETQRLRETTDLGEDEIKRRAIQRAERAILNTQQSRNVEDQSAFHTLNSFTRLLVDFSTTPIQYTRRSVISLRQVKRGQISAASAVRALITYWIILPQLFQFVADGFRWDEERQKRAAILGPFNHFPIIGDFIGTIYDYTQGETWKDISSSLAPILSVPATFIEGFSHVGKLFRNKRLGEDYSKELMEAIKDFATTGADLTGFPSSGPLNLIEGASDIANGKSSDFRRLIFSSYALGEGEKSLENPNIKLNKQEATQYIKDLRDLLENGDIDADDFESRKESFLDRQARLRAVEYWRDEDFDNLSPKERVEKVRGLPRRMRQQVINIAEEKVEKRAEELFERYKDASTEQRRKVFNEAGSAVQKELKELSKQENKRQNILNRLGVGDGPLSADPTSERTFIEAVKEYAKAIGTDPIEAFDKIFRGEIIRKTENGAVIVYRDTETSQAIRELTEATEEQELDHIVPLWLGGTNSVDNLKLVDEKTHQKYTAVGNKLRLLQRKGEITQGRAKELIIDMKKGSLTPQEVYDEISQ